MSEPTNPSVTEGGSTSPALPESSLLRILRIALPILFLSLGIVGVVLAQPLTDAGGRFPIFLSAGIVILGAIVAISELRVMRRGGNYSSASYDYHMTSASQSEMLRKGLVWIGFIVVFILLVWILSFTIATAIWLVLSLKYGAGMRWKGAAVSSILGLIVIELIIFLLSLPVPNTLMEALLQ